mgnify:FL=1
MIQSMTGFGRCQKTLGSRDITVEIKAVNHRYLEFSSRLPRSLGFIEDRLKAQVQSRIARGKVEVSVTVAEQKGSASRVTLNEGLALSYLEELRVFARKNGLTDDLALSDLCRIPELFTTRTAEVDEEALWRDISETADGALDSFIAMRRREGEKLSADLAAKLYNILTLVEAVERRSPETVEAYRQRLYKKLGELLEDRQIDDSRVLTEAALFADRVAVDEETVRLRSHIDQFRHILTLEEPVGRKLDFLVQEMNREANTIGSKAQDAEMARIVVELKSEIEKVREQIQNIE